MHDSTIDTSVYVGERPGFGPIRPGETRAVSYGCEDTPVKASVVFRMLLFENALIEGDSERAAQVFAQRERHAAALGAWLEVLQSASGKTARQARALLQSALASKEMVTGVGQGRGSGKSARMTVTELLASSLTDADFLFRVGTLWEHFEREREQALRHRAR